MAFVKMKPPAGVTVGLGADGKQYYVNDRGFANVDSGSVTKLTNEGWSSVTDVAPGKQLENVKSEFDQVTGGSTISTPTSTLKLPAGETDVSNLGGGGGAQTKIAQWVSRFGGVKAPYGVMASPPTVSIAQASVINSNAAGACSHAWNNAALTHCGGLIADVGGFAQAQNITMIDGTKQADVNPIRTRFMFDGDKFEAVFSGTHSVGNFTASVIVDGEFVSKTVPILPSFGQFSYALVDFGTNVESYNMSWTAKVAGGTGYAVGDIVTLGGGTSTEAAQVKVTKVTTGAITEARVIRPGMYSVVPAGNMNQASTTGAGTGATFSHQWSVTNTARKPRMIEVVWQGSNASLCGINVAVTSRVLKAPTPRNQPRLVAVGDSFPNGAYPVYAGGQYTYTMAQMLGLADNYFGQGEGGAGFITDSGNSPKRPKFSLAARVAELASSAGDVYFWQCSVNDGINDTTAGIVAAIGGVMTAQPDSKHILLGQLGTSSDANAATAAAFAAAAVAQLPAARIRYIDNITEAWVTGTGKLTAKTGDGNRDYMSSSDGLHYTQYGMDALAKFVASRVADAIIDMSSV